MAVPFDDATTALTTLAATTRTVYRDSFNQMIYRFGAKTNRNFRMSKRVIDGGTFVIQVNDRNIYGARANTDINADFPTPRAHSGSSFTVTLSETPSSNHMHRIASSLQVTWMDYKRNYNKKAWADDFINRLITGSMQDIAETTAIKRHLDSTGRVATVTGTVTKNDEILLSSCAALASTGGARFAITDGSLARIPAGVILSLFSSAGAFKYYVQVTDYNPRDNSVGVYGVNVATDKLNGSSTVDLSSTGAGGAVTSGDLLYLSDERNQNILSLGHWFSTPTASESFFGQDRTVATNRWLRPHLSGPSSSTLFSKTHIDDLSNQLGYIQEDPDSGYTAVCTIELEQRYRNEIGNDIFIPIESDGVSGKRLVANYGFDGSMYRHPLLGKVILQPDPLAPSSKIRFLRIGDWETLSAPTAGGENGWEWLPGYIGSMWYRMPSSTPGNGDTTTFRADGMMLMCDICNFPRIQAEIGNVSAT